MNKLFGLIHFILYGAYVRVFVIPKVNRLDRLGKLQEKRKYVNQISKNLCRILINTSKSTVEVRGVENVPEDTAVLFICNHQGYFDIPILLYHLPKTLGFLAKIEIKKWPLIGKWLTCLEGVFIDRSDIRQSLTAIKETSEVLKSGQSMIIFPEGTRSKGKQLNEFKPGSLRAALRAKVPIVPVTIENTYQILEANNYKNIKAANITITIAPAIETAQLDRKSSNQLSDVIFEIIKNNISH